MAKGHNQVKGINFEETFVPIARLESIHMTLDFACYKDYKLYQMDVRSVHPNVYIEEEVYVKQPLGFVDPTYSNYVFKLEKALYDLKQAPKSLV